jgi:predicted nucleic acid-binding protein
MFLPDVNLRLALAVEPHIHHGDAVNAAFARAAGFQLVTFDRGFARFANLNCRILP